MASHQSVLFYDAELTSEDLASLGDGAWLTDQALLFAMEVLRTSGSEFSSVAFVHPATAQLLKFEAPDTILLPSYFEGKRWVFFPVNNSSDRWEVSGGSHWSLLCWNEADGGAWFHVDSLRQQNLRIAETLASRMKPFLPGLGVHRVDSPQQSNGFDCGVFALLAMERIAQHATSTGADHMAEICSPISAKLALEKRHALFAKGEGLLMHGAT